MAGWVFVSILLAIATLLAAANDRPVGLIVALAIATAISTVGGALLRPDRQAAADDSDAPPTAKTPSPPDPPTSGRA